VNLNHLRVFAAIADASSITGGAQALKISQPAASKQLAELEANVGLALVDRLPRGVRLTPAGVALRRHARDIFSSERRAEAELSELLGLAAGRISIGASTTIGSYLLPPLFAQFRERYPRVHLSLDIANTAAIQSAVVEDVVDFGMTEGFADSDALDVEVFAHDEMVLIAAAEGHHFEGDELSVDELPNLPIILRERGSGTRDVIEASLRERGIALEPALELGSTESVKNAVAEGLGLALVSALTVELELRVGRLRKVQIADHRIRRALHLVRRRGKRDSPATAAFVEMVQRHVQTPG